jgi:hypothetical protein
MTITRFHRRALGAMVAAALGFGASQALASPAAAERDAVCDPVKCRASCRLQGQTSGACFQDQCFCYIT